MKRQMHHSIQQYGRSVEKHSKKISPFFHAAAIHRFRTASKKLRSLLRWQNIEKEILPGSFRKLYHECGDLRNAQLFLISLSNEKIKAQDLLLWLATYIGNRQQEWKELYREKVFRRLRQKLSKSSLQKPGGNELRSFFQESTNKLRAIIALPSPSDDMLHDVRKMVKDMQYIKQWCMKEWTAGNNAIKKISILQLKKLSQLAGDYNDKRTGIALIATYLEHEKNTEAIKAARRIQQREKQEKAKMKKQLIRSLLRFCENLAFLRPEATML